MKENSGALNEQDLQSIFEESQTDAGVNVETDVAAQSNGNKDKKAEDAAKQALLNKAYEARVESDPSVVERAHILGPSVEMTRTLAIMGERHNEDFILNEQETAKKVAEWEARGKCDENGNPCKKPRVLKKVPPIVGYGFRNIGAEPIEIDSRSYSLKDGQWVGEPAKLTIAPGQEFALSKDMTQYMMSRPEFSMMCANAKLVGRVETSGNTMDSFHMVFSEKGVSVHDDDKKVIITDKNGVVKKEYEATFGFCNNTDFVAGPKQKKAAGKGTGRAKKGKDTPTADKIAAYAAAQLSTMNLR